MNFEMTDDRRMMAESLKRYFSDRYDGEARVGLAYDAPYSDAVRWAEMAELGVLMALVPEAQGGLGGSGFDVMTVFQEIGNAICPEPVLPAVMAVRLLLEAGEELDPLMGGHQRYAVALGEPDRPYDPGEIETRAEKTGDGWQINGRKSVVYGAQVADRLLVVARNGASLSVFEVEPSATELVPFGMVDGGGAAEIVLDAAPGRLLIDDAEDAVCDALDFGRLALCAEAVGAMDYVYAVTLDYLKTRQQFGQPIGKNQVLQHRMVDLMTEIEQARSITILAASRMASDSQSRTVSMAKNLIGRVGKLVAEEAIQLHGGIAMTWEYPISHYAKRLVMIDHQLGDTDYHLARVMARYQGA